MCLRSDGQYQAITKPTLVADGEGWPTRNVDLLRRSMLLSGDDDGPQSTPRLVTEPHLATHAPRGDVLPLSAQEEILERFDIHSKTLFEDAPHERLGDQWETVLHLLPTTQPAMANLGIIIFHD